VLSRRPHNPHSPTRRHNPETRVRRATSQTPLGIQVDSAVFNQLAVRLVGYRERLGRAFLQRSACRSPQVSAIHPPPLWTKNPDGGFDLGVAPKWETETGDMAAGVAIVGTRHSAQATRRSAMKHAFRSIRTTSLALAALAALAPLSGCEPATQPVDASQVRPAGSAPAQEPGSTVKFDANKSSDAAASSGAATTK
jgi:hypothetical protein